jgi:hypothetical protein
MRLEQLKNTYLYENLDYSQTKSVQLWESAGYKLKEAQLTADQIDSIFTAVERGLTDAGSNRTMLGKGKDAMSAVNKAWEDLKTKVQDSGPIKNVDAAYDSAVAKIEKGLGGPDNAISKVIMGYRKFAKEHPIAQGLIYSALIAAAGISGAGLGGAAVLGLLKMTDKLLQGEKFSSAAYSGAKTGALAYGASKLGDYLKGKPEGDPSAAADTGAIQKGLADDQAFQDRLLNKFPPDKGFTVAAGEGGKSLQVLDAAGNKVWQGDIPLKTMDTQTFADLTNAGKMATPGISSGSISSDAMAGVSDKVAGASADAASAAGKIVKGSGAEMFKTLASDPAANPTLQSLADKIASGVFTDADYDSLRSQLDNAIRMADNADVPGTLKIGSEVFSGAEKAEIAKAHYNVVDAMMNKASQIATKQNSSIKITGKALSEGQVYMIFNRVARVNESMLAEGRIVEGPMDWLKDKAGKAMGAAQTFGKNLTTKVTADKLKKAWQKAGSPTDSDEVYKILQAQGVADDVIGNVYTDLKLPAAGTSDSTAADPTAADAAPVKFADVKAMIEKLPTDRKVRLLKYLTKQGDAAPAKTAKKSTTTAPSRDAGDGRIEPTMA